MKKIEYDEVLGRAYEKLNADEVHRFDSVIEAMITTLIEAINEANEDMTVTVPTERSECIWRKDRDIGGFWISGCDRRYPVFSQYYTHGFTYCPYCGNTIPMKGSC